LNFKIILKFIGLLLFIEGAAVLISMGVALLSGESYVWPYIYTVLACLLAGSIALLLSLKGNPSFSKREGFLIVTLGWILMSLFGSLPYIFSGTIPRLTDAFFETMSGFTTTGSSIVDNIDSFPRGILFWRAMTHWLGGMGIVVLAISLLQTQSGGILQLYDAEVPGVGVEKLSPHIYQTARIVWIVYLLLTLIETILLMFGGMSLFDSICHSFATMATGGFSTHQASIAAWPSPYIQYVLIVFMIIAGTNFTLLYFALRGKITRLFRDEEFRYFIFFILAFTTLIFAGLLFTTNRGLEQAFRDALFSVVSIMTTTGFVTVDYLEWTPFLYMLIFALFFFGGSTGSTGGSIKIMRIVILLKNSYYELRRIIHPHAVIPVKFNKHTVGDPKINNIMAFFMFYILTFFFSSIFLMIFVPDVATSMGAVATCLGNIGPGFGAVGPVFTFSHIPDFGKWFLSFLMMLGRLELFTVLVIFSPFFWRD
jgi:trk system potassium uptake protein